MENERKHTMIKLKVKDRFKDVERIAIEGPGYSTIVTLPRSLARNFSQVVTPQIRLQRVDRIIELEAQLDELLEAARGVEAQFALKQRGLRYVVDKKAMDRLCAAIAKAEGEEII